MAQDLRDDIARAKNRLKSRTLGSGRELRKLPEYLAQGEEVRVLVVGTVSGGQGLVALTDRRVLFLRDGFTGAAMEDFALSNITSVAWIGGLVLGKIQLTVAGTRAEIINVEKNDGRAMADAIRGAIGPVDAPSAPAPSGPDVPTQLLQLKSLLDAGVLSQDEYDSKKTEMLGRL